MSPPPRVVVAILAAGASRRLGTCKALVRLGDRTALEHLLRSAAESGAGELAVVAGKDAAPIFGKLERIDPAQAVTRLQNPSWERGRSGAVALAARSFPDRALLVTPVDSPLVGAKVFRTLAEAWERAGAPEAGWFAPRLEPGARHGHPVLLGPALAALARELDPDAPLRLLRGRASPLASIPVDDPAILDDLDTPEDLERLRGRFGGP